MTKGFQMTDDEIEILDQFLAGNWYDRTEDDAEIVQEFVDEVTPRYAARCIQILRMFLDSSTSAEEKANFIRKLVDRYIPEGTEAPIQWLTKILSLLEQASSDKPKTDL